MWVKYLVKFMLVLQFAVLLAQSEENVEDAKLSLLPNIWEDEVVSRMVRDVLLQDLSKEQVDRRSKRQYKRDIQSTATALTSPKAQTTGKPLQRRRRRGNQQKQAKQEGTKANFVSRHRQSRQKLPLSPARNQLSQALIWESAMQTHRKLR